MNPEAGPRSKPIDAFIGVSTREGPEADPEPSLDKAFERASELASRAGYVGTTFHVGLEVVPEEHNQWIRTYRVIITPSS